jgi:hypothetical protein
VRGVADDEDIGRVRTVSNSAYGGGDDVRAIESDLAEAASLEEAGDAVVLQLDTGGLGEVSCRQPEADAPVAQRLE